ncbi:MAG TPA: hypothetical protein VFC99_01600, partial [Acidimicrobiia bacterium]|nr:hypothetical protein [Acidimicrobiia bacterium]
MGHSSARAPQPRKRAAGRRFVVITAVTWLAVLALSLLAAPIALAQTDPTDPTLPPDTTTLPPD